MTMKEVCDNHITSIGFVTRNCSNNRWTSTGTTRTCSHQTQEKETGDQGVSCFCNRVTIIIYTFSVKSDEKTNCADTKFGTLSSTYRSTLRTSSLFDVKKITLESVITL